MDKTLPFLSTISSEVTPTPGHPSLPLQRLELSRSRSGVW